MNEAWRVTHAHGVAAALYRADVALVDVVGHNPWTGNDARNDSDDEGRCTDEHGDG